MDRFTGTPDSTFDVYCDRYGEALSMEMWRQMEAAGFLESTSEDKALSKCFQKGKSPEEAANIISRAFRMKKKREAKKWKPQPYFGPNGPTGHGDDCFSDADPGL